MKREKKEMIYAIMMVAVELTYIFQRARERKRCIYKKRFARAGGGGGVGVENPISSTLFLSHYLSSFLCRERASVMK